MKPLEFAVKEYWVYTLGYKKMADIKCRDGWANKHFAGDSTVEHSHKMDGGVVVKYRVYIILENQKDLAI